MLEAFYELRNKIFAERKALVAAKQEKERRFFDGKLWELRLLIRSISNGGNSAQLFQSGLELRAGMRNLAPRGWTQLAENKMVGARRLELRTSATASSQTASLCAQVPVTKTGPELARSAPPTSIV
jgi:hypothetical protein